MNDVAARAVAWLERAIPVVRAARVALLIGAIASFAGATLALIGLVLMGATGMWLVLVLALCLALIVPGWLLWSTRTSMAQVLDLPDALRGLGDLDDALIDRVEAIKDAAAERSGLIGTVRSAVSLIGEVRGSLDQELAPFKSAVDVLAPVRLTAAAFAMLWAGGALALGLAILALALVL